MTRKNLYVRKYKFGGNKHDVRVEMSTDYTPRRSSNSIEISPNMFPGLSFGTHEVLDADLSLSKVL